MFIFISMSIEELKGLAIEKAKALYPSRPDQDNYYNELMVEIRMAFLTGAIWANDGEAKND